MSRTKPTEFELDEIANECAECGAPPNMWCISKSGRWAGYPHAPRYYLAKAKVTRAKRDPR